MQTIYVQWTDDGETDIRAVFGSPQDPEAYPLQGEVSSDDARYAAYYEHQSEWTQAALIKPGD